MGYYYNPNIHPKDEYKKRLAEATKLAGRADFELIVPEYDEGEYFEAIKGLEGSKEERCPKCWELRLTKAAQKAVELGINCLGTTLRISPYQNQDELMRLGQKIATDFGLTFYVEDLVVCYRDSITLSKEQDMYRQKYCGCIYSKDYR